MYDRRKRKALVACSLLATVLTVTVGAAGRGETNEIPDVCHVAIWPMIPAECIDGGRHVRPVGLMADASQLVAEVTSEPHAVTDSGKGDLLHPPKAPGVRTVTVETRGDGISVLRRVQLQSQN